MKVLQSLVIFLFFLQQIYSVDIHKVTDSDKGTGFITEDIQIHKGETVELKVEILSRGQGFLEVLNLKLPIYDEDHFNGGTEFEGGILNIAFEDLDNDGYKDLILYGSVIYMDFHDKWQKELGRENVFFVFMYDPQKKIFNVKINRASFDIHEGARKGREKELDNCSSAKELTELIEKGRKRFKK